MNTEGTRWKIFIIMKIFSLPFQTSFWTWFLFVDVVNTIGKQEHQRLPFHQCLVSKQHFHVPWKTSVRTVYKPDYQYHITQVIFITMFKILLITIQAYDRYFIIAQMFRCIVFHYFQVVKTKYYMCAINIYKICEPHPQIFIIPNPFIAFLRMFASFSALKFLAGLRVGSSWTIKTTCT